MDGFWLYAIAACLALCAAGGAFFGARAFFTNPAVAVAWIKYFAGMIWPLLLKTFAEDFGPENTKRTAEETRRNERRPPKFGHGGESNK